MGVVCVFWVAPALGAILLSSALIGRRYLSHGPRALRGLAKGFAVVSIDALLYYAMVLTKYP
jgi:hypothetical protein